MTTKNNKLCRQRPQPHTVRAEGAGSDGEPATPAVPFGRQGTGWEVAYAALFLISNESSYVNAHTLFLDAGHMAGIVRG